MLQPVVIDGIRTPIGKLNGAMKDIQPEEIAAFLLQKICERSHLDIRLLDAVILGQAKQSSLTSLTCKISCIDDKISA